MAVFAVSGAHAAGHFVGGSAAFSMDDSHQNYLYIAPEIGWNYNEHWDFGIEALLGYVHGLNDAYAYGVAGFARYNVAQFGKVNLLLKGEAGVGFATISSDIDAIDGETLTNLSMSVTPMVTYDISDRFTLFAELNFLGMDATYTFENKDLGQDKEWAIGGGVDSYDVTNANDFKVGFLYKF